MSNSSHNHHHNNNEWIEDVLASCQILKWIGGYLCFTFICGIALNAVILYVLFRVKKRRSPINIFIIVLCSANLLAALLGIPLPMTSNLACRWLYGKYLCYYEGFIAYFVGMFGLYLLTALSLNRYWIIVKASSKQHVTFQTTYISVTLSALGGLFWSVPPIFGWNDYKLEGVRTSCSINWQARTFNVISYNILMFIFAYIVPLIIMVYCNLCIYLKVRKMRTKLKKRNETNRTPKLRQKQQLMEQRLAKTIFLIIAVFVIAWTPYAIVAFISSFFSPQLISPLAGTIPAIFAKSSIYFNPFVYIMSNSYIRSKIFSRRTHQTSIDDKNSSKRQTQLTILKISRLPLLFNSK